MNDVLCFLIKPIDKVRRGLRRYRSSSDADTCTINSYHDASVHLDEAESPAGGITHIGDNWPHDDPRWPKTCACGYVFAENDAWQLFVERVYRCDETGLEMTLRDVQPGAMWNAEWMPDRWKGPDGQCIMVRLPEGAGDWCIDGPTSDQPDRWPGWTRTGVPPILTASPSILAPKWHGWLRNGKLVSV